jgi:hypothetical protein
VCTGDGGWTPGGVALASSLHLSSGADGGFRLIVEDATPGDLLMGITQFQPTATPAASDGDGIESVGANDGQGGEVGVGSNGAAAAGGGERPPLEMGYHYLMGRRFDADGFIQTSPRAAPNGSGGRVAPRSIFYGGRSRRCCFATPTAHRASGGPSGPTIDTGRDGKSPATLAKLRKVGDWVEFALRDGVLSATDHTGHSHAWGARVEDGEIWVPTVAWTGSRTSVRLAPPALSETGATSSTA